MANQRKISIIVLSLFSSWLLSFIFEGQVLYAILEKFNLDSSTLVFSSLLAHFTGLFVFGFFIKNIYQAKKTMFFSISICILGSIVFFFKPSILWNISLIIMALSAGASIVSWSYYFKIYTVNEERIKTAADVLIISNILMVLLNTLAINISPYLGLSMAIIFLILALIFLFKISLMTEVDDKNHNRKLESVEDSKAPLIFLCLFIVIITINSGLMYHVINPAFQHHKWFVSWYWAVPYILALYIMKNLPKSINRNYILYIAIGMIGFTFVAFMVLSNSIGSYIVINTLMLGACGVYDLFWWSILGEMLDLYENPAKVFGIGLSANVLGVLVGGLIGNALVNKGSKFTTSMLAFAVVFVTLMILPLLHKQLSTVLKNHIFLLTFFEMAPTRQSKSIDEFLKNAGLTQREVEITELLIKGMTYKLIAEELYLSENTIKTHIRNIYCKLDVNNKTELFFLLMK